MAWAIGGPVNEYVVEPEKLLTPEVRRLNFAHW